jgi:hypothetical protein
MPTRRSPLALLAALACATALVACTATPNPQAQGGRIAVVENLSIFDSTVSAGLGDCYERVNQAPAVDDFSAFVVSVDIQCAAVAQGEGHSARIDANALLSFEHDGPDGGLSAIRFTSRIVSNRSATGLASAGTLHRVVVRFDVEDEPVAFTASAGLTCRDSFYDYLRLRDTDVPFTAFDAGAVFLDGCQGFGSMVEVALSESGTLPVGSYEIVVELTTVDWFTEEVDFLLLFGD